MNAEVFPTLAGSRGKAEEAPKPEDIHRHLAALNAVWQLYARAVEQQLDTIPIEALNRDFVAAREGLTACGIAEDMLVYDSVTMTFSLPGGG